MSWPAYCVIADQSKGFSANCVILCGKDGTKWGQWGQWPASKAENAAMCSKGMGSMVAVGGTKYMIVNQAEGCNFGIKGDYCLIIKNMKKCSMGVLGPKAQQGSLIAKVNQMTAGLVSGGY